MVYRQLAAPIRLYRRQSKAVKSTINAGTLYTALNVAGNYAGALTGHPGLDTLVDMLATAVTGLYLNNRLSGQLTENKRDLAHMTIMTLGGLDIAHEFLSYVGSNDVITALRNFYINTNRLGNNGLSKLLRAPLNISPKLEGALLGFLGGLTYKLAKNSKPTPRPVTRHHTATP